jgi:hypothetical protein
MKCSLSVLGLIFTLIGAAALTFGGLKSLAARIRQQKPITPGPWYQNLLVWLSCHFGSKDPQATEDYVISTAATHFWGFFFIFVGTILQILGAI